MSEVGVHPYMTLGAPCCQDMKIQQRTNHFARYFVLRMYSTSQSFVMEPRILYIRMAK